MASAFIWHTFKNLFLLSLSLVLLPLDTAVISVVYLLNKASPRRGSNNGASAAPAGEKKTVLVTGVSMAKGLALARLFHRRGHRVIGADFHSLSLGQVSAAIDKFYGLPAPKVAPSDDEIEDDPYVVELLELVRKEGVDLWISCSDVNAAVQDALARDVIEAQTSAKAIQLSLKDVTTLHEKDLFMEHVKSLGLPVPDTQVVNDKASAIDFLNKRGGLRLQPGAKQYLLKPIGVNDLARFDQPLLPLSTEQETLRRLNRIPFGESGYSFILQEFIRGPEFCTHALVVRGRVLAFVACPSASILMHYSPLPAESPLSQAMLAFTKTVAEAGGRDFTGHISFDFLVQESQLADTKNQGIQLYPIECNPRVHTAVVFFNNTPELVDEYLSALQPRSYALVTKDRPLTPQDGLKYYWIGQDLVESFLYPLYQSMPRAPTKGSELDEQMQAFINRVRFWKDGTFEAWDPWPWWWMYHVYWPSQFLQYLVWGRWHKINVSTGKAFQAK